ncbi:MAG: carboxypeptidase regulatory-like domain-containing protein [Deltaproteobacteria bacterium]|nr:carboxypeptidase regulatory-like domain-containing protein [Deltaproteobacteria bacterium]
MSRFVFVTVALFAAVGCGSKGEKGEMGTNGSAGPGGDAGPEGAAGPAGDAGATGPTGNAGPSGDAGAAGTPGASGGTITGSVKDTNNAGLVGATISTSPTSSSTASDVSGNFSLASVPNGVFTVIATLAGYGASSVTGVSVTAGGSTSAAFVLYLADGGFASISGTVKNTAGAAIANATVSVSGVDASAVTAADGTYTITNVPAPGPYFLDVAPPTNDADAGYFAGDTRVSLLLTRASHTDASIILSARPSSAATYIGTSLCALCHAVVGDTTIVPRHASAGHWRSLSLDGGERFVSTSLWPSVGATVDTGKYAQDPNGVKYDAGNGGSGWNRVYLCQNSAGSYAMMFGPNPDAGVDAGCTGAGGTTQGIVIPVAGTYGGEGDRSTWDGGIVANLGKFKQRFFARVNDVDSGTGWTYTAGKDKDLLVLPVQVTQSGDGYPKFDVYKETEWANRNRTFAYACAGCHNTNMNIVWDQAGGSDYITSYAYTDLNVGCEKCHGPGSEHVAVGGGLAKAIINPKYLTADRERQVCGQCHSGDDGKNEGSQKKYGYAYNLNYADAGATYIGRGTYVPGFYDISEFISNLDGGASFNAWATIFGTKTWGKAHRQQYAMLLKSKHVNNTTRRMTCASCHDVHSTYQGPKAHSVTSGSDTFVFETPRFNNNVLCLSCHAGSGEFATMATSDVAAIQVGDSRVVSKNGTNQSFTAGEIASALERVGDVVEGHMNNKANMGFFVMYDPEREPGVGRCMNCHMPRTAKSGGYTTGVDEFGKTALIEGDQGSHVFDVIRPQMSRIMTDGGVSDTAVMPNSCGPCHARYRFSGDGQ